MGYVDDIRMTACNENYLLHLWLLLMYTVNN